MQPLRDFCAVTLAINLPGPVAAAHLSELGASVTKVEPPSGDPVGLGTPKLYRRLTRGQKIVTADLKTDAGRNTLFGLLSSADLLLTSSRPAALDRLGLAWSVLHTQFPKLCQVAIVGFPAPLQNRPGHDLTYQAQHGLLAPPNLPKALIADLGGAQNAVIAAVGALLARERGQGASYTEVSLADAAHEFSLPLRYGLTASSGILGGAFAGYGVYETNDGWVAVGCLEPHFRAGLAREFNLPELTHAALQQVFRSRTSEEWEHWGAEHDLPIEALRNPQPVEEEMSP